MDPQTWKGFFRGFWPGPEATGSEPAFLTGEDLEITRFEGLGFREHL